jgi:hypothetical protein
MEDLDPILLVYIPVLVIVFKTLAYWFGLKCFSFLVKFVITFAAISNNKEKRALPVLVLFFRIFNIQNKLK